MIIRILTFSLALTLGLGLQAMENPVTPVEDAQTQAIAPQEPLTVDQLKTAITNLDVETISTYIAQLDKSTDTKETLDQLKIHAKIIRTDLRVQLAQECKKSRIWAGIKSALFTMTTLSTLYGLSSTKCNYLSDYNALDTPWKIGIANALALLIGLPAHGLVGCSIPCNKKPGINAVITAGVLFFAPQWAYHNGRFAYYGTTLTEQKLHRIEQIIEIIKTAQQTHPIIE